MRIYHGRSASGRIVSTTIISNDADRPKKRIRTPIHGQDKRPLKIRDNVDESKRNKP